VGGRRGERDKWVHVYDGVTALLFCVALDECFLRLREDNSVWRIHESLSIFKDIIGNSSFRGVPIVLLLTKKDLFEDLIANKDINVVFPEYLGGSNYKKAIDYITNQFSAIVKDSKRFHVHVTCALESEDVSNAFTTIRQTVAPSSAAIL